MSKSGVWNTADKSRRRKWLWIGACAVVAIVAVIIGVTQLQARSRENAFLTYLSVHTSIKVWDQPRDRVLPMYKLNCQYVAQGKTEADILVQANRTWNAMPNASTVTTQEQFLTNSVETFKAAKYAGC